MNDPENWCDCPDRPVHASSARTLLDHPGGCEFPAARCTNSNHARTIHNGCSRPLRMLFCGCMPSGYTLDVERGWWVHYSCGWPTRAWFEAAGRPAPDHLAGIKPVTYHEFVVVPRSPKKTYEQLSEMQRALNDAFAGTMVWD